MEAWCYLAEALRLTATRSPFDAGHGLGRLEIVAEVHDLDNAMAYRPRLETLAWEKFPDVMHRLFDKYAPADAIFRIERLDLDLGVIRPAFLESDAIAALEQSLKDALSSALHDAKNGSHDNRHLIDTPLWRLQRMETFLRHATPGLSADLSAFDPASEAIWLLDNQPDSFAAMLDRQQDHPHALERLFLQLDGKGREKLLNRLAPGHSAAMILLMKDMEDIFSRLHHSPRFMNGSALLQKFWSQAIAFLVRARGSSLDLPLFLTQILANIARQLKITFPEFIAALVDSAPAPGQRPCRHPDLEKILAALNTEYAGHRTPSAIPEAVNSKVPGVEQWRKLLDMQASSSSKRPVSVSSLRPAQFDALLEAWVADDLILAKRKILVGSLSSAIGGKAVVADKIDQAMVEYIASHIDKSERVADPAQLWQHVLAAMLGTKNNPLLVFRIIKILTAGGAKAEQEIVALLDRALEEDIDIGRQSSGLEQLETADFPDPTDERPADMGERSPSLDPDDNGTSRSSLKSAIDKAMAGGTREWRQWLHHHARTAGQRADLLETLSRQEFRSLLIGLSGDPVIPDQLKLLASALSDVLDKDVARHLQGAVLEYFAKGEEAPIDPGDMWEYLLCAVIPSDKFEQMGKRVVALLTTGSYRTGQQLATILAEILDRQSGPSFLASGSIGPDGEGQAASESFRRAGDRGPRDAAPDYSAIVQWILQNPQQQRALFRSYASHAEQRAELLAAMNDAQFALLLGAITGDSRAGTIHSIMGSAISNSFGTDAAARANADLLGYLAEDESGSVSICALWVRCLEVLFPATMSPADKSARSRQIFDLLPYEDEGIGSEIFHFLRGVAHREPDSRPGEGPSGTASPGAARDRRLIESVLGLDGQSLLDSLRETMPRLQFREPAPITILDEHEFETIVRRLRLVEIAPLFRGVEALLKVQSSRPFLPLHRERLAERLRYLVVSHLIWRSPKAVDLVALWEDVIDRLARSTGTPVDRLASRMEVGLRASQRGGRNISALEQAIARLASPAPSAPVGRDSAEGHRVAAELDDAEPADMVRKADRSLSGVNEPPVGSAGEQPLSRTASSDREALAAFLRKGRGKNQRDILVRAARQYPASLAAHARNSLSSTNAATAVAERLLLHLTPVEILNIFAPEQASGWIDKAPKSGQDKTWWIAVTAKLLSDEQPALQPQPPRAGGPGPAQASSTLQPDMGQPDAEDKADPVAATSAEADGISNDAMSEAEYYPQSHDGNAAQRRLTPPDRPDSNPMEVPLPEPAPTASLTPFEREALAAYLATGARQDRMAILVEAARQDPVWLKALARALVSSTTDAMVVADRLLFWLLPLEIVEFLAPAFVGELSRTAPRSGDDKIWWTEMIAGLLAGELPSAAREAETSPIPHVDLLASLRIWLEGGAVPENAARQLMQLTRAERISLLRADTVDATLQKLRYAATILGPEKSATLLQEMTGWTMLDKRSLASLAGDDKIDQQALLVRAAAANLVSTEIDLSKLSDPLPDVAETPPVQGAKRLKDTGSGDATVADLIAWLAVKPVKPRETEQLIRLFNLLVDERDSQLLNYISTQFQGQQQRNRLVRRLPEASWMRLLYLVVPNDARTLHDGIMLVKTAGSQLRRADRPPLVSEPLWTAVFDGVTHPGKIELRKILLRLVAVAAGDDVALRPKIRARALALAGDEEHMVVAAALRHTPESEAEPDDPIWQEKEEDFGDPFYIANAGLILVNPLLPNFFEQLDLLQLKGDGKPYIEPGPAASRAVHLLQYLVTGQTATPEPHLFLNKIICGLPTGTPVASAIEPDPKDIEICDGLLAAILEHWPALHGTSVEGLRETFLQREGRLRYVDQQWMLEIQRNTIDILKDQVPWNTSVIYHPWMSDAIHVTW